MTEDVPDVGYGPGGWVGFAGPSLWLLAELDPADPLVGRCWTLVRRGGPVDDVLDAIVSVGFRSLPSFALGWVDGAGGRIVVRGTAAARTVDLAGAVRQIRADGARTWTDQMIGGGLAELELIADAEVAMGCLLPLSAGIGLARALRIAFAGRRTADDPTAPPNCLEAAAASPSSAAVLAPPPIERAVPVGRAVAEPEEAPNYDHLFGETQRPEPTGPVLFLPEPDGTAADRDGPILAGGWSTSLPPEPEPQRLGPAGSQPSAPARSIQGANGTTSNTVPPIIDSMPWNLAPAEAFPPAMATAPAGTVAGEPHPDASATEVDHAEAAMVTIDRSRLPGLANSRPSGPTVLAARCPAGHLSPANAGTCRVCRAAVPAQEPVQLPRPPLGVLRLSTGDVVTLDRGVVMGRAPEIADLPAADRPHVVRLAHVGGDISRAHVEITLDGWHVLVSDLNSTNGTTVTPPGQPPVRLRPADPLLIESGTLVSLADGVSFRYEVTG
jgi:hypothetical protein